MNLAVLQWLLKNQSTLRKIAEIAKGWSKSLSYEEQWAIVDSIARLVLPLVKESEVTPRAMCQVLTVAPAAENEVGAEYAALGIDWKLVTEVILPIVISILQALAVKESS
jgi:hypothetical protein